MPRARFLGLIVLVLATVLVAMIALAVPERDARAAGPPPYLVVVNQQNGASSLSRRFVSDVFLKKSTRWSNDSVVKPVDLGPDSSTRRAFSEEVLKRSVAEVKSYWQQVVFAGRDVPPPELAGDDEVLKFVAGHPGAIGYVSGTANVSTVKVVSVVE